MATSIIKQSAKKNTINISANSVLTNVMNHSHYISDKVIHVRIKAKINTVPSSNDVDLLTLPEGIEFTDEGITIPIYKATGEWNALNQIIYAYISSTKIVGHKSDIQSGNWIFIDTIGRIK